ncbi:hypothetical protein [Halorussus marinus]|uniref:hypothetical protein n=1 Tax=Halorussus marinus TaxID=2505976 RepID=UPI001092C161|nr:hypothetical protein [Halorussus marinus]
MSEKAYTSENGHPRLKELERKVVIRHQYKRGEQAGEAVQAKIRDGHIIYNNQKFSPSGAAREANSDVTNSEYEINGWTWWEFFGEEKEEWVPLETLRTDPQQ